MTTTADAARQALALVDLTNLDDDCTDEAIDELCSRAVGPHGHVAAVCVWPAFVRRAATALRDSGVRVATVVNFPHGSDDIAATSAEAQVALGEGADEIDLVLPYHAFVRGDVPTAAAMVDAVRAVVPSDGHVLKVILETGALPDAAAVTAAASLAIAHGADFVKTSTGKLARSASLDATAAMLGAIRDAGRQVGLKPSGGIRTLEDARLYIEQAEAVMGAGWVTPATFRFGASGLLTALLSAIDDDDVAAGDGY